MPQTLELRGLQLDALREVVNIASGHAATALSQLTDRRIMITVPDFAVATLDDVPGLLGYGRTQVVVVAMHILGDLTGSLVFLMPEYKARELSAMLLRMPLAPEHGLNPMARSSLNETANILGGAYTSALGSLTRRLVMLSVPTFGIEPPDHVLAGGWRGAGNANDQLALCVETRLSFDDIGAECGGHMLLLPSAATLQLVLEALRVPNAAI